jgi:serine/threonine-protein kinase
VRFGRYAVVSRIGIGGMGEVFHARTNGPDVALKLIRPEYADDSRFRQMFLAEAELGALLDHPNIAGVVDYGEVDGTLYLATQLVDGVSLHGLQGSALPLEVTAYIVTELLSALDYVHRLEDKSGRPLGLVHRDVSLSNVLLSRAGEVKLSDFGVHKIEGQQSTGADEFKGKPAFMAPEQLPGGTVDHRADLFAAGVVLHVLALGRAPFSDVRAWLADGAPLSPSGPLGDVIARTLAPDPAARVESARELAALIRRRVPPSADAAEQLGRYVDALARSERPLGAIDRLILSELEGEQESVLVYQPDPTTQRLWIVDAVEHRPARRARELHPDDSSPTVPLAPMPALPPRVPSPARVPSPSPPAIDEPLLVAPRQPGDRRVLWPVAVVAGVTAATALTLYRLGHHPLATQRRAAGPPIQTRAAPPRPPATKLRPPSPLPPAPPPSSPRPSPPPEPVPSAAPIARARPKPRPAPVEAEAPVGYLTLDTMPWASVYLGSRRLGTTPFARVPLPAGRHRLTLDVQDRGQRLQRTVDIEAGEVKRVALRLR